MNSGFIWEITPLFGALMVFPEHRCNGDSMPFGDETAAYKDAESLTYLNSEQALADYVVLITDLKKNLSAEASPVVLFGGSYGGMLAAWFRLKYPHIAIGAISSSAPILQFEDIASPYSFMTRFPTTSGMPVNRASRRSRTHGTSSRPSVPQKKDFAT